MFHKKEGGLAISLCCFPFSTRLANLYAVSPELLRCAQPFTLGHWRALYKRHGFKTIINLRGPNPIAHWYQVEKAFAATQGLQAIDVMLSSKHLPSRATLLQLLDAYQTAPKPIVIKCSGGSDRTGLASGLYLVAQGGVGALPQARGHLRLFPYLHYAKPQQRWIKEFWNFFEATHKGQNLRTWIETVYSAEALADYLTAQGKGDYWRR